MFVVSFGDNAKYVSEEVAIKTDHQIVILRSANSKINLPDNNNNIVLNYESYNPIEFIKSIYHLATSKVLFLDNYFGFLSVTDFKNDVQCIQLWHAAGAIKQFGLKDPTILQRSETARNRFNNVYKSFNQVIVGSEKMVNIFEQSFGLNANHMLRVGIPRTDFFFDNQKKNEVITKLTNKYPVIKDKKVILYAPTYRDDKLTSADIALDIVQMYKELGHDYVLLLRLHPAVKAILERESSSVKDFVYDVSSYEDVNHLLLITDLLITDYSSIPFEFSLLEKPMIFFAYDLEKYERSRGFWEDYESNIPGPLAKSTNDIVELIKSNEFDYKKIRDFAQTWNEYSTGNSTQQLIQSIYNIEKSHEKRELQKV